MKRVILFLANGTITVGMDKGNNQISFTHQYMGSYYPSYAADLLRSFEQDGYTVDYAVDNRGTTKNAFMDACGVYPVDSIKGGLDKNGNRIYYFRVPTDKAPAKGFFRWLPKKEYWRAQACGHSDLKSQIATAFEIPAEAIHLEVQ